MHTELKPSETALLIKITHSKPIEVKDFVATMSAVGSLFDDFCRTNGDSSESRRAKLYVEKIEHGSIEIFLTEAVTALALPFLENMNIIMEFAGHLKDVLQYYAKGKGEKPSVSIKQFDNLRDVFAITAGDVHGNLDIGAVRIGTTAPAFKNCTFNFNESNTAQNQITRDKKENETQEDTERVHERQLMTIFQMRGYTRKDTGNKAKIDALFPRPLPLLFDSDELKRSILGHEENPTQQAYQVDVVLQTINGKPAAYKVVALHDIFPLDGGN